MGPLGSLYGQMVPERTHFIPPVQGLPAHFMPNMQQPSGPMHQSQNHPHNPHMGSMPPQIPGLHHHGPGVPPGLSLSANVTPGLPRGPLSQPPTAHRIPQAIMPFIQPK